MIQNRQIITIGVGEAGISLSSKCYEALMRMSGILADGAKQPPGPFSTLGEPYSDTPFFASTSKDKFTPRMLLLDTDRQALDRIERSTIGRVLNEKWMIGGKEDSACNFARARSIGKNCRTEAMELLSSMLQKCESPQGFLLFHSISGGTGSAVGGALTQSLTRAYPKLTRWNLPVYPSAESASSMLETYNSMLGLPALANLSDLATPVDNEQLFDICSRQLQLKPPSKFEWMNQVFSGMFSSLATRFQKSTGEETLGQFCVQMTPLPRFHFPICSYYPFAPKSDSDSPTAGINAETTAAELFSSRNLAVRCDLRHYKFMATAVTAHGNFDQKKLVAELLHKHKKGLLACWNGFNTIVDIRSLPVARDWVMEQSPRSASAVVNSTGVESLLSKVDWKCHMMFKSRAYLHWYLAEGMDELEFEQAMDVSTELISELGELGRSEEPEQSAE